MPANRIISLENTIDSEFVALVVAIEDKRFWNHHGVDFIALARASLMFLSLRANGGASTLDMQLARLISGRRERTIRRKIKEILLARKIRKRWGPKGVLARYFCWAYCGTGIRGVFNAAILIFGQPLEKCSLEQKALLASLLLCPRPTTPTAAWHHRANKRAKWALVRFNKLSHRSLS